MKLFCGIVLLAFFVVAISADVAEKLKDDKSATNAEGAVKGKRFIHFHSYSSPYVYRSPIVYHSPIVRSPLVVHHAAPIVHAAPIYHAPIVATHAVHPLVSHSYISHAPLVAYHHFKRR